MIKNYKLFTESVRDKMTPKSEEDIVMGFMTADAEDLLKSSFENKSMMGIKYVLDNYKLYGKETKYIISSKIPTIENKDDMFYLLNNEQVIKFLNSEQIYVLEKYVLGLHQNEMRSHEKALLKQLDNTDYYQSKDNLDIMIGKNKRGDKNYFNYNKKTRLLTHHLDNMSSWLMGEVDDDDNYETHRADKNRNDDGLGWYYDDLIMMGIIGKKYDIEIDKTSGSTNDGYSFVEK